MSSSTQNGAIAPYAAAGPARARIVVVSEPFAPDESASARVATDLALMLARWAPVEVWCGGAGSPAPSSGLPGLTVTRCAPARRAEASLLERTRQDLIASLALHRHARRALRPGDRAVVIGHPPLMPSFILPLCRRKGVPAVFVVHDVYPEALVAAGVLPDRSPWVPLVERLVGRAFRHADKVVAIGRDMRELLVGKRGVSPWSVTYVPLWADLDSVRPEPRAHNALLRELGWSDRFVVQHAGTMGRTHDLDILLRAAARLEGDRRFGFLFVGRGAKRAWLERQREQRGLDSVVTLDYVPDERLSETLAACDVSVVSYRPGMRGVSVPSRVYNVLAAGRPIVAVMDSGSEIALMIREEEVGWVVEPGDDEGLVRALREAAEAGPQLEAMGRRARQVAECRYAPETAFARYRELLGIESAPAARAVAPRELRSGH